MKKTTLLVILMTLACSTEPGDKILPDVQLDASGAEASTHDGAVELGTVEEDVAVAPEEVNTDTGFEISPECEPGAGCFLDPCENSGDCLYGPCVQHLGNKVCSQGCVEECPDGWLCEQIADTGPDLQFACVSSYTHLCLPCTNSDDCESASGVQDVCVAYGNKGSFCGADCVEGGCPMGYSCVNALTVEGAGMMQCVADAGICSCSEQAEKLGLSTPCAEENEFGLCPGQRICGPEGLSICDALVPGPEECNGADDDCDGNVDNDVCIDESECTKDSCDPEVGCVFQPLTGTTCDDADVCSLADHCEDGQCMGTVINCDDDNPCTTDSCDPAGGCVYSFNSSTCDDDDPCTVGDACVMGSCTGTQVPCDCQDDGDCLELEDGDVCNGTLYCDMNSFLQVCKVDPQTVIVCDQPQGPGAECFEAVCQAKTGECEIEPDNDGFFCEDNNPCTVSSLCEAGECVGGVAMNCGDDNDCTEDSCEPTTGCVHTPNDNLCEDGNLCTIGDSCVEGKCLAGQQLTCNDGNSCTDDSCQPAAGCVHMMNTAPCNDGNACTTGDTCLDGACTGTGVLPCNDGNPCTDDSCDSVAGCGFVNNSAACTDGNPCTANDQCKDGACQGQGALDCDDGSACTDDACSPVTGCTHVNNVAPCSDGNVCTMDDACDAGVCQGQGQLDCEDNNACTDDWCEPLKGCLHTDNGAACNDSNECTVGDKCQGGKCKFDDVVDCDDGNPCTKDSCQSGAGCVYVDASGACDDGNPCTTNDYCENGGCISGAGQTCDDGNPCTDDSCDDTGQCQHAANDFDCDDGNECTDGDICTAGSCVGGELLDCDDENICTTDTCSPAAGCIHTLNNAPCDDDNVCTTKDACNLGKCVGASPLVCDDGNPCTDDSCNGVSGCVFVNNDAPCNDDSLCTDGEECSSGWCVGIPVVCNDNNLCTDDSCAPDQGCTFDHNAAPCDDDNACTINDVCLNGVCSETQLQDCEDNNVCTDDSCDELLGCVNANNIEPCTDNNVCTEVDVCAKGVCVPGQALACDDADVCTDDSCHFQDGCLYAPVPDCCNQDSDCDDNNPNTTDKCDNHECKNLDDPGLPHNSQKFNHDHQTSGGCGNYSTFYTKSFGSMNWKDCEAKANLYGAQFAGAPELYGYNAPYKSTVRWFGEKDGNTAYVSTGGWNSANAVSKSANHACVLAYANASSPGNSTFSDTKVVNGKTYHYKDYGNTAENTCYTNCRQHGARPLNPQIFGVGGTAHMVENHSCHGSLQYAGGSYGSNGSADHTYKCFIGYYAE